jgi:uncharacterized protein YcbK (DUF882 family)
MSLATDLEKYIDSLGLRHFKGRELTWLWSRKTKGGVSNSVPPRSLWPNIVQTLVVVDRVRHELDRPLQITSAYRSPAYNAAVGGARFSQHVVFNALDVFSPGVSPARLAEIARGLRGKRLEILSTGQRFTFRGGIGVYPRSGFVHIDTRGHDADW